MTEVVAFPDAEKVVVTGLNAALTPPVSTKIPNPRPAEFVRVLRAGGSRGHIMADRPLIVVECWAADSVAASALARLARAHAHALAQTTVAGAWVRSVSDVGGPNNDPDPDSGTPRYVFTVQLDLRGEVI